MENFEVWTNSIRENSEVFISEFSVLSVVQNGKLGVWSKYLRVWSKCLRENLLGLHLRVFGFGYRVKKPRKNILRDFRELRVFDLSLYLLDIKCVTVVYTWCTQSENKTWVYCQSRKCRRKLHQKYEIKSHIFFLLCAYYALQQQHSDSETKFQKNWLLWYLKHQINYCTSLYSEGCKVVYL